LTLEYLSDFFILLHFMFIFYKYKCLLTVVKLGRSDRHYIYYRVGCKMSYGSEISQTIPFRPLGKVVKIWSIVRMKSNIVGSGLLEGEDLNIWF
jgi:hypothetical protein